MKKGVIVEVDVEVGKAVGVSVGLKGRDGVRVGCGEAVADAVGSIVGAGNETDGSAAVQAVSQANKITASPHLLII